MRTRYGRWRQGLLRPTAALAGLAMVAVSGQALAALTLDSAVWDGRRLTVSGTGRQGRHGDRGQCHPATPSQVLGTSRVGGNLSWTVRANRPSPVPCAVDRVGARRYAV